MKKKLISILVAFGMAQAEAEKHLEKVEETDVETFDPASFISNYQEKQKELLKNDKDFVSEIIKPENAKRNDMFRASVKKRTGLTAEEIKDKTNDEILDLAIEKLRKKGDQTMDQIQAENIALINEVKRLKEEELPAALGKADQIKKQLIIESKVEKMIDTLPKKLRVSKTAAIATLKEKLGSQFEYDLDDKGELVIVTKEGRMKPKSKDGTKLLTAHELITESLDEEKLLENSGAGSGTGTGTGADPKIIQGEKKEDDVYKRFPHLAKAQQMKEEVKQTISENAKA